MLSKEEKEKLEICEMRQFILDLKNYFYKPITVSKH